MLVTEDQWEAWRQARATRVQSSLCLLAAFDYLGPPRTMMDVGCGDGHMVRIAEALGVSACGLDIVENNHPNIHQVDLCNSVSYMGGEMVLCLEVAEHLPEHAADHLCEYLSDTTYETLLFSAATPGQGGSGHLNEQPWAYWVKKLHANGLTINTEKTDHLRKVWTSLAPGAWWYGKNCMVFERFAQQ